MKFARVTFVAGILAILWLAAAGCGGGSSTPPPPSVSVVVSPTSVNVPQGGTQAFNAVVSNASNPAVNWKVQEAGGGSISNTGAYTAPNAAGTFHVVATSQADSTVSATATVTVPAVAVAVSPNAATVFKGNMSPFAAMVTGTINTTVTWSVQEGAAGGTITSAGLYTAPQTIGTFHIIATSQADSTKSATAIIAVPSVSVAISPFSATLGPKSLRTFVATVEGTNNTAVTWSVLEGAAGGTIDANGNYVAPTTQGTFHVVAISAADLSKSASAAVAVLPSGFTPTGSPGTARAFPTATLLPNGKVLVTGAGTAELYDPASGSFTATGNMVAVRYNHTASLLPNGKVLVAGGFDNLTSSGHVLASTELFDPATDSFAVNSDMGTARALHTATLLANGKVLLAGGQDNLGHGLASAELYDPASGIFTATGSMGTGRESHTATLLPNGKVLVAGGLVFVFAPIASAELFDPAGGTFAATGSMTSKRTYHTATLLPNGKVLVAGGLDSLGNSLATAELFDPASGNFNATGGMGTARAYHLATLLSNGDVFVTGGLETTPDPCPDITLSTAELFIPVSGSFTVTGSMGSARQSNSNTATLLQDGKVLVEGGGLDNSGKALASAELYH